MRRGLPAFVWFGSLMVLLASCSGGDSSDTATSTSPASSDLSTDAASEAVDTVPPDTAADAETEPGASVASTAAPQPEISADEAATLLAATSLADPQSIGRLDLFADSDEMVDAAARLAATGPTGDTKWAVVYVLANADGHAADLAPFLADDDPSTRVMAAIGTIGQGDAAGFPVLIEALGIDQPINGLDPPMPAWVIASNALARHTALALGPAFDADPLDRSDALDRWREWWAAAAGLTFDPTTELWSA